MTPKTVHVLVAGVLVVGLGAVCAPTVGAIPPASPMEGTPRGETKVSGVTPTPGFSAIAAGSGTGYGLGEDGGIWAWGYNGSGQLGNGTTTNSYRPVRVQVASGTLPRFTAIAARGTTGYGLGEDGRVWAWGEGHNGQLGNGTTTSSLRPVRVQAASGTLPRFTVIAAGDFTGYGLSEDGDIWAWGLNGFGQLGNGDTTDSSRPVRVRAASGTLPFFTAIAAGGYTGYGLSENGDIWAWGYNNSGQLGNGTTTNSSRPVRVQAASGTLPRFTAIAAGGTTGYGLSENGDIWAWGYNNSGQLGNGINTNSSRPVRVQSSSGTLPRFTAIAAGGSTGYGLSEDGGIWAWGSNSFGQLGNGTTTNSSRPVRVQAASGTLPRFTAIAAGGSSGYGLSEDGGIWAWGDNGSGQLGNGTTTRSSWPLRIWATVKSVTFGGIAAKVLYQDGGTWTVITPAGCGPVPVVVTFGFESAGNWTASAGVFTFGAPPRFTVQPSSGPLQADGQFTARVSASGDQEPKIQWQMWTTWPGRWVDLPGATGPTLSVRPPVGTEFRAVATNCWTDLDSSKYTAYSGKATATAASVSPSVPGASPSPSLPPNTAKATTVGLAMKKLTMKKNTTLKAVALAYPISQGAKLSWTSSNPKVAKVNPTGKIKALKPGRAVITAKAENGKLARLKVTVVAKEAKVKTVKVALKSVGVRASKSEKIVVKKGKVARLSVLPNPQGATLTKMPTFKSSKPKVASVDKTGLVTAKKKGKTKIKVTLAGQKTTLLIQVT
ncbi:MAG: Ig-like domain-containing protein [Micrococcales bacterium]|nr:Ig-like domain-containing protein [Micrococcales bacterium]